MWLPALGMKLEAMEEEDNPDVRVDKVYVAKSTPKHVTKSIDNPSFGLLAFQ